MSQISPDKLNESHELKQTNLTPSPSTASSTTSKSFYKRLLKKSSSKSRDSNYYARIIKKSGQLNIAHQQMPFQHKHISYIKDLGNTLLTIRWRWILLALCAVNFASYFVFSFVWMLLAYHSGDYEPDAKDFCIAGTKSFTGYYLLSIETITSIGYGRLYPSEKCGHFTWLVLTLQAMIGIAIQGVFVSAVYVKMAKPFTKISHFIFSRKAVIMLRDGKMRFIFRIYDSTGKVWCGTKIYLYYIDKENGFHKQLMKIQPHGFLIFPLEIEHVIDDQSPLWELSVNNMQQKQFELVAMAEGVSTITGQLSQNRTSYEKLEILWGHRFLPCTEWSDKKQAFVINYRQFNEVEQFADRKSVV